MLLIIQALETSDPKALTFDAIAIGVLAGYLVSSMWMWMRARRDVQSMRERVAELNGKVALLSSLPSGASGRRTQPDENTELTLLRTESDFVDLLDASTESLQSASAAMNTWRVLRQSRAQRSQPATRRPLPDSRASITHKFNIAGNEGYLTVGLYEDGLPGELHVTMAKEGSTVDGLMDALGTATSLALQYGVPLESLVNRFTHQRFEPAGMTANMDIPYAKSLVDYIFRWMGMEFIPGYREANAPRRQAGVERPIDEVKPVAAAPPERTRSTARVERTGGDK